MGFELTEGAIFYIVMMLIVVFIGIAIVAGTNPREWFRSDPLSRLFEPGRLTEGEGEVSINCEGAAYVLTLEHTSFEYGGKPSAKDGTLEFVITLEKDGQIFTGKENKGDQAGNVAKIICTADENGEGSTCPPKDIEFSLQGIGVPGGNQTFHFIAWKYNDALISAAGSETMDKLLDTYSSLYVSSFDKTYEMDYKCREYRCKKATKEECEGIDWCYLSGFLWWELCRVCPTYVTCSAYDSNQCVKCPFPKENCEPGTIWGCNVRE